MLKDRTPLIVAEVAQTHEGSLGLAHAFIDAVATTGADAIKFQTHIAAAESTPDEPFRVKFSRQDKSRYDYWKRMEFTEEQWAGLKLHAEEKGLVFLSSPFSLEAVDLLERLGIAAWKIGSGEVGSRLMLEKVVSTGKPVLLSSGMSAYAELDRAVELLKSKKSPFTLLQCTTSYPCPAEKIGLNVMLELRERYSCPVGLSDHSGTIYPSLAAVTLGASMIEVHVALTREMFGPDVASSVTVSELKQLVEGARFIQRMNANPVNKDQAAGELKDLKTMFGKSAVARRDLPKGTALTLDGVAFKKPGSGIPEEQAMKLLGKTLIRDIREGAFLRIEDFQQ